MTIYNQYYYAKEDPAHRFLMDERGWDTLLTRDGVNVILLLFLLALCVPVFCGEYQCGMAQILRSCRNGRGRLVGIKLGVMAALAVLAALLLRCSIQDRGYRLPLVGRPGWSLLSAAKPVLF